MQKKKKKWKEGRPSYTCYFTPHQPPPCISIGISQGAQAGFERGGGGADPLASNICSSLLAPLMRPNFAVLDPSPLPPPPPPLDTSTPNLHQYLNRVFGGQKETLGVPLPQRLSYSRAATSEQSLNGIGRNNGFGGMKPRRMKASGFV